MSVAGGLYMYMGFVAFLLLGVWGGYKYSFEFLYGITDGEGR